MAVCFLLIGAKLQIAVGAPSASVEGDDQGMLRRAGGYVERPAELIDQVNRWKHIARLERRAEKSGLPGDVIGHHPCIFPADPLGPVCFEDVQLVLQCHAPSLSSVVHGRLDNYGSIDLI
jgi:hypothetical protein